MVLDPQQNAMMQNLRSSPRQALLGNSLGSTLQSQGSADTRRVSLHDGQDEASVHPPLGRGPFAAAPALTELPSSTQPTLHLAPHQAFADKPLHD